MIRRASAVALLWGCVGAASAQVPGSVIAFQSNRAGSMDIFVTSSDGAETRRLTTHPGADYSPAISPDGGTVAFVSDRDGGSRIYVVDLQGGEPRRLTTLEGDEDDPAWAPDGTLFFRKSTTRGTAIWGAGAGGADVHPVTDGGLSLRMPSVSPDGTRLLAMVSRDDGMEIWILNVDGSGARAIATPDPWAMMPTWSPDGSRIAYASASGPPFMGSPVEVRVMNPDGTGNREVTRRGSVSEYPCWSPDGRWLAFQGHADGDYEIYLVRPDGSDLHALIESEGLDGQPHWGPGRHNDIP